MPIHNLRDLFEHGLTEAYDMETRLVGALDQMARDATDPRVRQLVEEHREQTRMQAGRLRKAFDLLHREPTGGEGCRGILGILAERDALKALGPSPEVLQTFDVAAAAKVEHYEIAVYEGLLALAEKMELDEVAGLLGENLSEEREALRRVSALAHESFAAVKGQASVGQKTGQR